MVRKKQTTLDWHCLQYLCFFCLKIVKFYCFFIVLKSHGCVYLVSLYQTIVFMQRTKYLVYSSRNKIPKDSISWIKFYSAELNKNVVPRNLPVCYPDSFSEYFDQGPCSLCPKVGIKESILPLGLMMMKKHKYKGRSNVEKPPREVPQLRHTSRVVFQSLSFFLHYAKFWHHTFRWSQVGGSHL